LWKLLTRQWLARLIIKPELDRERSGRVATERQVTGFHRDEEGHWVAELECEHNQHV
jgi:hypothetical protein